MTKRFRNVLLVVLAPWLLYLAVGNLLIATPLLQSVINRHPNHLQMTWSRAFTWWPGRVHLEDFQLTLTTRAVAFDLTIDRANAHISLGALLHRTFRTTRVRSSGVSYRMFVKEQPDRPVSPRVLAWPHLKGVIPLSAEPSGPPMTETERKRLWTVNLQDIDTTFREVWIDEYHWKGVGHAKGSFALKPLGNLWVGPVACTLEPGELTVGDALVSKDFGADFDLFITPVEIDMSQKRMMLRGIQFDGRLTSTLSSLEFVRLYGLEGVGTGRLDVDAHVESGALTRDTRAALSLDDVRVRVTRNGAGFDGDLATSAWVSQGVPQLHASGEGTVHVALPRGPVVDGAISGIDADAVTTTNDLALPWRIAQFDARVPELHIANIQPILDAFRRQLPTLAIPLVKGRQLFAFGLEAGGRPGDIHVRIGEARVAETSVSGEVDFGSGKPDGELELHVATLPIGVTFREGRASLRFFRKRHP